MRSNHNSLYTVGQNKKNYWLVGTVGKRKTIVASKQVASTKDIKKLFAVNLPMTWAAQRVHSEPVRIGTIA